MFDKGLVDRFRMNPMVRVESERLLDRVWMSQMFFVDQNEPVGSCGPNFGGTWWLG